MPQTSSSIAFDATITISVIVSLCAIISPLLTALINNHHHTKIRKLELQQQRYQDTIIHRRSIFENYFRSAGQCFNFSSNDNIAEFGNWQCIAIMYAPPEFREQMIQINNLASRREWSQANALLEDLASKMYTITQSM